MKLNSIVLKCGKIQFFEYKHKRKCTTMSSSHTLCVFICVYHSTVYRYYLLLPKDSIIDVSLILTAPLLYSSDPIYSTIICTYHYDRREIGLLFTKSWC